MSSLNVKNEGTLQFCCLNLLRSNDPFAAWFISYRSELKPSTVVNLWDSLF